MATDGKGAIIIRREIVEDKSTFNLRYTNYYVRVKNGKQSWELEKRYSDFVKLYERLKAEILSALENLKLPPKKTVGIFRKAFLDKRQQDLDVFLNNLACHEFLSKCSSTREFLGMTPASISTGQRHEISIISPSNRSRASTYSQGTTKDSCASHLSRSHSKFVREWVGKENISPRTKQLQRSKSLGAVDAASKERFHGDNDLWETFKLFTDLESRISTVFEFIQKEDGLDRATITRRERLQFNLLDDLKQIRKRFMQMMNRKTPDMYASDLTSDEQVIAQSLMGTDSGNQPPPYACALAQLPYTMTYIDAENVQIGDGTAMYLNEDQTSDIESEKAPSKVRMLTLRLKFYDSECRQLQKAEWYFSGLGLIPELKDYFRNFPGVLYRGQKSGSVLIELQVLTEEGAVRVKEKVDCGEFARVIASVAANNDKMQQCTDGKGVFCSVDIDREHYQEILDSFHTTREDENPDTDKSDDGDADPLPGVTPAVSQEPMEVSPVAKPWFSGTTASEQKSMFSAALSESEDEWGSTSPPVRGHRMRASYSSLSSQSSSTITEPTTKRSKVNHSSHDFFKETNIKRFVFTKESGLALTPSDLNDATAKIAQLQGSPRAESGDGGATAKSPFDDDIGFLKSCSAPLGKLKKKVRCNAEITIRSGSIELVLLSGAGSKAFIAVRGKKDNKVSFKQVCLI